MLCPIKDEDPAVDTEGCDQIRILGLIPCLVHFSRVLDLLSNVAFDSSDIARLAITANLSALLVVFIRVGGHCFGDLDIGNLKIIGTAIRGVSPEQKSMVSEVFALWLLDIGKPLDGEGWPGQGRSELVNMGLYDFGCASSSYLPQYHVVQEGAVFLPSLVFFRRLSVPYLHAGAVNYW